VLTPITIMALLTTLVLLFSFKGETRVGNPLTILWIAIPLCIQTLFIFWLGYWWARLLKLEYRDAAPAAMIGASNHFEVAIATATMLFGLRGWGAKNEAEALSPYRRVRDEIRLFVLTLPEGIGLAAAKAKE
jgi:ACR3 family arsenite transporter